MSELDPTPDPSVLRNCERCREQYPSTEFRTEILCEWCCEDLERITVAENAAAREDDEQGYGMEWVLPYWDPRSRYFNANTQDGSTE